MPVTTRAWSPDGRFLLAIGTGTASGVGVLAIVHTQQDNFVHMVDLPEPPSEGLAVSSDGKWLAIGGDDGKGVIELPGGGSRCINREFAVAQQVAFSPDGRFVASVGSSTGIVFNPQTWVYDAETGETVWRDTGDFDADHQKLALAFSPDNRFLASIMNAEAFVYDAAQGGRLRSLAPLLNTVVTSIVFTADSRFLVAGTADGRCVMVDVEAGTTFEGRVLDLAGGGDVAVSADGQIGGAHGSIA